MALFDINILSGNVKCGGVVDLLNVEPFVDLLTKGSFEFEADVNQDGVVEQLDVRRLLIF